MKVGDLFKFNSLRTGRLHGRMGVYLGEDFIHRDDGVTVENHKVLLRGDGAPTIIDRGLLTHMEAYNAAR